jgi:hypothetical protein
MAIEIIKIERIGKFRMITHYDNLFIFLILSLLKIENEQIILLNIYLQ